MIRKKLEINEKVMIGIQTVVMIGRVLTVMISLEMIEIVIMIKDLTIMISAVAATETVIMTPDQEINILTRLLVVSWTNGIIIGRMTEDMTERMIGLMMEGMKGETKEGVIEGMTTEGVIEGMAEIVIGVMIDEIAEEMIGGIIDGMIQIT